MLQEEEEFSMGIRQREMKINELEKENFGLKMKIHFLQETIQGLTPKGLEGILFEYNEIKANEAINEANLVTKFNEKEAEFMMEMEEYEREILKEKQDLLLQFDKEKQDLLIEFDKEKQDLLIEFDKEKQGIISKGAREKQDLLIEFDKEKQEIISKGAREKQDLLLQFDKEKQEIILEFDKEKQDLLLEFDKEKQDFNGELNVKDFRIETLLQELKDCQSSLDFANQIQIENQKNEILSQANQELLELKNELKDYKNQLDLIGKMQNNEKIETNRMRYIKELKERNLLLVRISQHLDSKLGFQLDSTVNSFETLKLSIMEKLRILGSIQDIYTNLSTEKSKWIDKCDLLDNRITTIKTHLVTEKQKNKAERQEALKRTRELITKKDQLEFELEKEQKAIMELVFNN
jgi:hypothetical protein